MLDEWSVAYRKGGCLQLGAGAPHLSRLLSRDDLLNVDIYRHAGHWYNITMTLRLMKVVILPSQLIIIKLRSTIIIHVQ